jgi:hypothetical protein
MGVVCTAASWFICEFSVPPVIVPWIWGLEKIVF